MGMEEGSYNFSWDDLGDLKLGRPNLGCMTSVVCYRLMEYTFKDVLTRIRNSPLTSSLPIWDKS